NAEPLPAWSAESFVERKADEGPSTGPFSALAARLHDGLEESSAWQALSGAVGGARKKKGFLPVAAGAGALLLLLIIGFAVRRPTVAKFDCEIEVSAPVSVSAAVDGTLAEVKVHDGQSVAKGDLLARLDKAALEAEIGKLTQAIDKAHADAEALKKK